MPIGGIPPFTRRSGGFACRTDRWERCRTMMPRRLVATVLVGAMILAAASTALILLL
jgi:hypothetical protein